jgi:DNA integrity scanning protein DisA with diadenylate cyclase activity
MGERVVANDPRIFAVIKVSHQLVQHAHALAKEVSATAVVVYADAVEGDDELRQLLQTVNFRTILFSRSRRTPVNSGPQGPAWISIPDVHMTRTGQARVALLLCFARGLLHHGDRIVFLTGLDGSSRVDTVMVLDLGTEPELFLAIEGLSFEGDILPEAFERVLWIATQLGAEGREGRPVGTIFVLGDAERVLAQSRQLVLNPFHGYPESERSLLTPNLDETIKEFSAIDGAFIVRGDGVVLGAGAQLVSPAQPVGLPSGLGTRHAAAAAITAATAALAVCVSQSTGTVTVFKAGRVVTEIHRATTSVTRTAGNAEESAPGSRAVEAGGAVSLMTPRTAKANP